MKKITTSKSKESAAAPIKTYVVKEETTLLPFLIATLSDKSRTTIKSLLTHRQVAINEKPTTRFDEILVVGNKVSINFTKSFKVFSSNDLRILFEDDYLIVINKSHGLLTMGTEKEKQKTAYRMLSDYVKEKDPRNRIFILHRLDKETSGVMMFAKRRDIQEEMQTFWNYAVTERKYVAVIEGEMDPKNGEIESYLNENEAFNVYSTAEDKGRYALTRYRTIRSNGKFSLIELDLETGRKNQIRVHLSEQRHPIAGDRKYGANVSPIGRMALHASKLKFIHPVTKTELTFSTPTPSKFSLLLK